MVVRSLACVVLGSLTCLCFGCAGGSLSVDYHDHRPVRRTHVHRTHVHRPHVHTHRCRDCYYDGDTLLVIKGHRHGPGCGHHWDGRRWVVRRTKAPPKLVTPHRTVQKSKRASQEPRVHKSTPVDRAKRAAESNRVQKSRSTGSSPGTQKSKRTQKSKSHRD